MLQEVQSYRVTRGMTRSTILSGWGFPTYLLPVVLGVPIVVGFVTRNILWPIVLIPAMTKLARMLSDDRDDNPRVNWLAVRSGSMFALREDGVERVHPLLRDARGTGLLDD